MRTIPSVLLNAAALPWLFASCLLFSGAACEGTAYRPPQDAGLELSLGDGSRREGQPGGDGGVCVTVNSGGFEGAVFPAQATPFEIFWDAWPGAGIEAGVGLAHGPATSGWGDLAVSVRFNPSGKIDALDGRCTDSLPTGTCVGGPYHAEAELSYAEGGPYRIRATVDVGNHRYSVRVTPPAGSETLIAQDYTFRSGQQAVPDLDHWGVRSDTGSLRVCSVSLRTIAPPLAVAPVQTTANQKATVELSASGGAPPYRWSIATNASSGVLSAASGAKVTYTTGSAGGAKSVTDTITVSDSDSTAQSASATITVKGQGQAGVNRYGHDPTAGTGDDPAAAPYGGVARYVDPVKGVNSGAGTLAAPWADLKYAAAHAEAGDTIYLRGGKHAYGVLISSTKATAPKPIQVRSYPGEWAVFDGTGIVNGHAMVSLSGVANLIMESFEVINYADPAPAFASCVRAWASTNITFKNIYAHKCAGVGIALTTSTGCLVERCTAADNYDPKNAGDNADGFEANASGNVFRYCLADYNSDDGFDFWDASGNKAEYCVAHNNGRGTGGNGNGFKFGSGKAGSGDHTFIGCIALANRNKGFDTNATPVGSVLHNCLGYGNLKGNFYISSSPQVVTNCSSVASLGSEALGAAIVKTSLGGIFGGSVTAAAFEAVDFGQLNSTSPGSRFFYPVSPSLIDKGTDVGYLYAGAAPDIGAVESGL